jgi:hypothetical protein
MDKAITFGKNNSLIGILTIPDQSTSVKEIGVICLNAGLLHRVGPFRMNVELANYLAKEGYNTLRFDSSSIGDSGNANNETDYLQSVTQDIKCAVDLMESRTSLNQFVLFGLCTGADNAHRAMTHDKRIVGGIFLDGYAYPSLKFMVKHYMPIILSPSVVAKVLSRAKRFFLHRILRTSGSAEKVEPENIFTWQLPNKKKTEKELKKLLGRGAKLYYVFSSTALNRYNYENQYFDSMPFLNQFKHQFKVILNQNTDHTYRLYHDRLWLYNEVSDWLDSV